VPHDHRGVAEVLAELETRGEQGAAEVPLVFT
jgi:hypothetical protein